MKKFLTIFLTLSLLLSGLPLISVSADTRCVEGEAMTLTAGRAQAQNMEGSWPGSGFSGGYQLWVQNTTASGSTTVTFRLSEAWEGDLYLSHCLSSDYGIFDIYVDGQKIRANLDMFGTPLRHSGAVRLGAVSLGIGTHTLTLTCVGKNAASRGYYGSIDCLTLREPIHAEYDYTYTDTVAMLTDLEAVAKLPEIGEVGAAATSYHRVSRYDEATDTYIEWGDTGNKPSSEWTSNGDGSGNLGTAHGGILAADIHGAGMIVRSWFATIRTGTIEFYIDGSSSPTISMPLADFASAEGVYDGLDNMVYKTTAEGYNNYVPVTFNSSCQIVLKGDWGQYYHFSYRLFPEGTTVEPMPAAFNTAQREALENANAKMGDPAATPEAVDGQNSYRGTVTLPKSTTVTAFETDGTAAITQFKVKLNDSLSAYEKLVAMQKIEVFMYWDGEDSPAVWAPLGDFFANAGGGEYASVPMGITADGTFYSYWYMPYADGAKIAFKNSDTRDYSLSVETVTAPLDGDVADYGRFHAKWSLDRFQPTRADRAPDYTLLTTEGRGRLVGINLHVNNFYGVNWWGEGDEKFFVDGEMFPSTYGTGSEDYFGYAWCSAVYFNNAFHAQNQTTGLQGKAGDYNNVRFHLADNIPFQTSFEAAIEKFYGNDKVQYLATAYWYLDADGTDPYTPVTYTTDEEIAWRYLSLTEAEKRQQPSDRNTIEGEDMAAVAIKNTSNLTVQNMAKDWPTAGNFSGGKQLFSGISVQSTAEATLQFTADTDYEGVLSAVLCTAADYATVQLLLDGELLGDPIDCYNTRVYRSAVTPLGNVSLTKGVHELTIRVVGKNEASRGYLFGLDCLVMGEHLVTYQSAADATCTEIGWNAHWKCIDCEATFADRFATVEITPTVYFPEGHSETVEGYIPPTIDAHGYSGDTVCGVCGKLIESGTPLPMLLRGDVDGNRTVDSTDARLTLQYAVKKVDENALTLATADVNNDQKVDSTDARLILQYAVKKIHQFPNT
ncbi:MAG: DUF2961 domain-containing protein [Ruminococcaceae bacterium]|nr:DUF2961 domain-containing protein [Oscillospiraceae bacterium]